MITVFELLYVVFQSKIDIRQGSRFTLNVLQLHSET